ncbi:hypothetical protein B0H13DRAFT_2150145, partial [Mycena leptocephala]
MSACLRAIATPDTEYENECFHSPCCVDGHYGARTFSVVRCVLYEMVIGSGGTMAISPSRRRDGASQRSRCAPRSYRSYVRFASFHLLCLSFSISSFMLCFPFLSFCCRSSPLCSLFLALDSDLILDYLLEVRSCERAAFRLSCPWAWNWPGRDGRGGRYPSPISGPRKGKRGADGSRWDAGAGAVPRAGVL